MIKKTWNLYNVYFLGMVQPILSIFLLVVNVVIVKLVSLPNHKSYRIFYLNDFVQNSLGIIFLTSDPKKAAIGQKHPSKAKESTKDFIY